MWINLNARQYKYKDERALLSGHDYTFKDRFLVDKRVYTHVLDTFYRQLNNEESGRIRVTRKRNVTGLSNAIIAGKVRRGERKLRWGWGNLSNFFPRFFSLFLSFFPSLSFSFRRYGYERKKLHSHEFIVVGYNIVMASVIIFSRRRNGSRRIKARRVETARGLSNARRTRYEACNGVQPFPLHFLWAQLRFARPQ